MVSRTGERNLQKTQALKNFASSVKMCARGAKSKLNFFSFASATKSTSDLLMLMAQTSKLRDLVKS